MALRLIAHDQLESKVGLCHGGDMSMTADEVLATVAALPREDWVKIQSGIADLITTTLTEGKNSEIGRKRKTNSTAVKA
jgi:hypothetical protein